MQVKLSIGDFSRMTYLSVKALRHYHDIGVLEPVEVDPASGYRSYAPSQVGLAQMIRRLRDLGMPLEEVRTIVRAPDASSRDEALVAHLQRMERQLAQTRQTVASLRTLLQAPGGAPPVQRRTLAATPALVIAETVVAAEAVAWWMEAFGLLHQCLGESGLARSGPDGALFPAEFFEAEQGEVTAFVPLAEPVGDRAWLPPRVRAADGRRWWCDKRRSAGCGARFRRSGPGADRPSAIASPTVATRASDDRGMDTAPDGSPVQLYARLPERAEEAALVPGLLPPGGTVLDLGCGMLDPAATLVLLRP